MGWWGRGGRDTNTEPEVPSDAGLLLVPRCHWDPRRELQVGLCTQVFGDIRR